MVNDLTLRRPDRDASACPRVLLIDRDGVRPVDLAEGAPVTIGRGTDADIVVPDPEMSRRHAEIAWRGTVTVTDLGSKNGTRLRGTALVPHVASPVFPGESVELGSTTLVVEQTDSQQLVEVELVSGDGNSGMDALRRTTDRVAASNISVLLLGETGVGKGVFARRIHDQSPRASQRFLELNCAALPEQLLEAELFGHEKAAFTGASIARPGLLEVASGGTVFLDEIGELPPAVQVKLLRVLEDRQVMRIGGRDVVPTDLRFVSATNRDLQAEVAEGRFRRDLYYRLNGISVYIPPLRQRQAEIISLAQTFLEEEPQIDNRSTPRLSGGARAALLRHDWPGNVRELRNVIHRASVLCDQGEIEVQHLQLGAPGAAAAPLPAPAVQPSSPSLQLDPLDPARDSVEATDPAASADRGTPRATAPEDGERQRILEALDRFAGNQTKAARHLGISRTTLSTRLDAYQISRPRKHR